MNEFGPIFDQNSLIDFRDFLSSLFLSQTKHTIKDRPVHYLKKKKKIYLKSKKKGRDI
jgi:hypothetical protein